MSRSLFSPGYFDDSCDFASTSVGSPLPVAEEMTEQAFEELHGTQDPLSGQSPSENSFGFAEFLDSLNLPTPLSPKLRETVMKIRYLVADLYVGEKNVRSIQHGKEATHRQGMNHPLFGYPFVLKVFMAAGSSGISGLCWSEDGLELEVNYLELQDHLTSGRSEFRCSSITQFTDQLVSHGFMRIYKEVMKPADICHPILLYFEHPDFAQGGLEGLLKLLEESRLLRKNLGRNADEQDGEADEDEDEDKDEEAGRVEKAKKLPQFRVPLHLPAPGHVSRMGLRGDKCCFTFSIRRSSLQAARCRFRTLLDHLATVSVLEASGNLTYNSQRKPRTWEYAPFLGSSIRLVKPHDSVIVLDVNKPPDYAGYYGQVGAAKVTKFFSEYLPRYGNKLTGYKDIVLETSKKPSNFQQNLPIGLASSDGEDFDAEDVQPPLSPADVDSDLDCRPSTSAAAAKRSSSGRKRGAEPVNDLDLEEAMQELCGGSTVLKVNASLSRGRAKAQQPKTPKATPRKRTTKRLDSSSSDIEAPVSQKGKRAKKEIVQVSRKSKNIQLEAANKNKDPLLEEGPSSSRGRAKAQQSETQKSKPRKRLNSSSEDEPIASPKGKRLKKEGLQATRKMENIQLKNIDEEAEEETLVKKTPKQMKHMQVAEEDAEQDEVAEEDEDEVDEAEEHESAEEEEYVDEEYAEEEYVDEEYAEEEYAEEEQNAEQDDEAQENEDNEENEYNGENEENTDSEDDEDAEEQKELEDAEELEENEDAEELEDNEDAEEHGELEEDEGSEEDEDEDGEENYEDDDDDDYNVQYRAAPQEPEKRRRYDLRNSKRQRR